MILEIWCVVFPFIIKLKTFFSFCKNCWFLQKLFGCVLLNFQMFYYFPYSFLLISNLISLRSESIFCMNLAFYIFYFIAQNFTLVNVPCTFKKWVHFYFSNLEWNVLKISVRSVGSIIQVLTYFLFIYFFNK